jgi:hypothetical protein
MNPISNCGCYFVHASGPGRTCDRKRPSHSRIGIHIRNAGAHLIPFIVHGSHRGCEAQSTHAAVRAPARMVLKPTDQMLGRTLSQPNRRI